MRPENRERISPGDIVLAAHPGSGTSWIGTLLVHLGIFYISGEDEVLVDRESQRIRGVVDRETRPLPGATEGGRLHHGIQDQLDHLPTLRDRDRERSTWREPLRVIKTTGSAVGWQPPGRVLLLVRDGRDAVLSLYHNYVSFTDLKVPLLAYLQGNDGAFAPPPKSWAFATTSWMGSVPRERLHLMTFEAAKEQPHEEFRRMLDFLGVERTDAELGAAIGASSYDAMRREESREIEARGEEIGSGRILRKGTTGQWRDVYSDEMLATFAGMPRRALKALGYPVDTIPLREG
jgi:hypothetical protein